MNIRKIFAGATVMLLSIALSPLADAQTSTAVRKSTTQTTTTHKSEPAVKVTVTHAAPRRRVVRHTVHRAPAHSTVTKQHTEKSSTSTTVEQH
jgi:hypothetical protein